MPARAARGICLREPEEGYACEGRERDMPARARRVVCLRGLGEGYACEGWERDMPARAGRGICLRGPGEGYACAGRGKTRLQACSATTSFRRSSLVDCINVLNNLTISVYCELDLGLTSSCSLPDNEM